MPYARRTCNAAYRGPTGNALSGSSRPASDSLAWYLPISLLAARNELPSPPPQPGARTQDKTPASQDIRSIGFDLHPNIRPQRWRPHVSETFVSTPGIARPNVRPHVGTWATWHLAMALRCHDALKRSFCSAWTIARLGSRGVGPECLREGVSCSQGYPQAFPPSMRLPTACSEHHAERWKEAPRRRKVDDASLPISRYRPSVRNPQIQYKLGQFGPL